MNTENTYGVPAASWDGLTSEAKVLHNQIYEASIEKCSKLVNEAKFPTECRGAADQVMKKMFLEVTAQTAIILESQLHSA